MPTVENHPQAVTWLDALEESSRRLRGLAESLPAQDLEGPSFATEWNIAQVLSHLGSAAEICTTLVERGLAGDTTGPKREHLLPVWERWNTMDPEQQRREWVKADTAHLELLRSIDSTTERQLTVPYFAGPLTLADYAGYRLSEQSIHAWDVEVARDEIATVPGPEAALLWRRIDLVASRFFDQAVLRRLAPQQLAIRLTDTSQLFTLDLSTECHLRPDTPDEPAGTIAGTAEAILRLIYGRSRPADLIAVSGTATRQDATALFPGY